MNYELIAVLSQLVSALLFYAAMVWIWLKFLAPALKAANENTNRQIAEAERHRNEAKAAIEAVRLEIEGARRDARAMIERVKERAQHERDAILAEAKDAGDRSVRNADGELARSRMAAREQLRETLADKALEIARTSANTRIDTTINARLVQEFIEQVSRG
ncbi:MAG TPA: ATP synthase F0 subunit B [Candidatus Acidoferrum sp.]|nr:ATP synthase F0 subunit B [Candidatus Acidoferrum sp.]